MDFLIFDGGMGTQLQARNLPLGVLPETYNITHPEVVLEIHKSYVAAGAEVVTTNTFQANALKISRTQYTVEQIVQAAVSIAKQAGAKQVALDLGPTGQLLEPLGTLSFEKAYDLYKEQILAGAAAGADIVLIETMGSLHECKAAVLAAKENCDLPVYCTMTFQGDGRTFLGTDPETAVLTLQGLGVSAVGINCSLGPKELVPLVKRMLRYAKVPVMVQPNAGLPHIHEGHTIYRITADEFSEYMLELAKLGVSIMGGCCGTTPEFISSVRKKISNITPVEPKPELVTATTSATKYVILDNRVTVIGERINPTGKKKLKEALRSRDFDFIIDEATEQVSAGADILDINAGLPEIDEAEMLTSMIKEVSMMVNVPLQIDSADASALNAASRIYNGKPIINSVNGKGDIMAAVFPIVKKYGALVVCLTLDEGGIPATAEGRVAIAKKMMNTALSYGIPKEDLLIDCLTLTASSHQEQVMETIKAIKLVKSELGLKTVLGVSNVSFGLPAREILNSAFLAASFGAGLDTAILNPLSEEMMKTFHAFKVLNNNDAGSENFIELYAKQRPDSNTPHERSLQDVIIDGRCDEAANSVSELLKSASCLDIIDNHFIPALDAVGLKYERGEIFLPQLIHSAEAVKAAFTVLREHMGANEISKGKIVLATVSGDIHDIGKNIVKSLLENYGYEIIDLGKDVPPEEIVAAVKNHGATLVGLSALMTTTVKSMKHAIEMLHEDDIHCKIMVGGAVLNSEYAQLVGADFYGKDARDAVRIAAEHFEK